MRLFLLLSLYAFMLLEASGFTDKTDGQALLDFKSQVSTNKRDNSFVGNIPQELGNLFRLQHLNLSRNVLEGEIPPRLSNCSRLLILSLDSNRLLGGVPSELGSLAKLVGLFLSRNSLTRNLPTSLGNLTSLKELDFNENHIQGVIPDDIGRLTQMVGLGFGVNNFSGGFPPSIYNLSSLQQLFMGDNRFSGSLRQDFGKLLPNLRELVLGNNHFTGLVPSTLANISTLRKLALNDNNLTGSIPPSFGKLQDLQWLLLQSNSLGSYSSGDLEVLDALTNCTNLQALDISSNRLGGDLPTSIVNLSAELYFLNLGKNFISGSIPNDIGNLVSLQSLGLQGNMLRGALPTSFGKLVRMEGVSLTSNKLSGEIPSSIGNLTRSDFLYFDDNRFEGNIPPSLSNCTSLHDLWLASNKLVGTIPREIMQIQSLFRLDMSGNSLTGSLSKDVGRLEHLVRLSVAYNQLSGQLPQSLGNCLALETLLLQGNDFVGVVPDISGLKGVKRVDFSNNSLSGSIPTYLANFSSLEYLNLSINDFEGSVPTDGKFRNGTIVSVFGNKRLCGGIAELKLKPCLKPAPLMRSSRLKKVVIGVSIGASMLLLLLVASVSMYFVIKRRKKRQSNNQTPSTLEVFHEKISYGEIRNATDGFSTSNIIGSGSFGVVYKALLSPENNVVAVKVLNMERRGAMRSFMAECVSLRDIRHRNLVKLLTACSSIDFQGNEFRALVYEFMPNGNLDTWLHPEEAEEACRPSKALTLLERLNISIDVSSVLDYLHVHCHEPIAHCDLKPSNVLINDDLSARVSDFGLARLLLKFDQESFLNQFSSVGIQGTIGYAAPEYGMGGLPSIQGDIYSFGVLLLEMFTGKRPTDTSFAGNLTLHNYTKSALPEGVLDIADQSILHNGLRVGFPIVDCLLSVFDVGLRCCEESPVNRMKTSEVLKELISIRERFFKSRRTPRR